MKKHESGGKKEKASVKAAGIRGKAF